MRHLKINVIWRLILFKVKLTMVVVVIDISIIPIHEPTSLATYRIKNDSNNQAAARTGRHVLIVCQLVARNFEPVAAWTWVVVYLFFVVPCHVLDFDFVVVGAHDGVWVVEFD